MLALRAGCSKPIEKCAVAGTAKSPHAQLRPSPKVDLSLYTSQGLRPFQDPNTAFAVAISGGGHRSANFALGVLLSLEKLKKRHGGNWLSQVDYISTASGGGFVAGAYVASLFDHLNRPGGTHANFSLQALMAEDPANLDGSFKYQLRRSYYGALGQEVLDRLTSLRSNMNRGDVLEAQIDQRMLGQKLRAGKKSVLLGDIFQPASEPRPDKLMPFFVANATSWGDGAIVRFAPNVIADYGVDYFHHNLKEECLDKPADLPLSVGVKAGSSVPVVIPPTVFGSHYDPKQSQFIQLIDAAYSDNLGVMTAMQLLHDDRQLRKTEKKVLLVLDANRFEFSPFESSPDAPDAAALMVRLGFLNLFQWESRYQRVVDEVSKEEGATPVIVGFGSLSSEDHRLLLEAFEKDPAMLAQASHSNEALGHWYHKYVLDIGTSLKITAIQQDFLIRAGELAFERAAKSQFEALDGQLN